MKFVIKKRWSWSRHVLLFALLLPGASAWGQGGPPALVEVALVVQKSIAQPVTFVGTVKPRRRSLVATEVEGLVKKVVVEEGQRVSQDDLLVQLRQESLELALRVRRGTAERSHQELVELKNGTRPEVIEEAHAAVLEAEAELERAQREKTRQSGLNLRGVAALQTRENAETAYRVAEQRLLRARASYTLAQRGPRSERIAQAKAQYQAAQAEVARLRYDLQRSQVTAPFTGFVVSKQTEVGQWLHRGDPVVTLIELGKAHITVLIPERYIPGIQLGTPAQVIFDALPGTTWRGKIIQIIPQATESRTFPVTIEVDNPQTRIKSGFFARVTLSVGEQLNALLVPKDAIVSQGPQQLVYIVRDGKAVPVAIEGAGFSDGYTVVKGPLHANEQVVIRGNERLRPGQPVRIAHIGTQG
jgi:multidrug efflux pump subunit AcrA (membrane-fusion protein)